MQLFPFATTNYPTSPIAEFSQYHIHEPFQVGGSFSAPTLTHPDPPPSNASELSQALGCHTHSLNNINASTLSLSTGQAPLIGAFLDVPSSASHRRRSSSDAPRPSLTPSDSNIGRSRGHSLSEYEHPFLVQGPSNHAPATFSTRGRSPSRSGQRLRQTSPYSRPGVGRGRSLSSASTTSSVSNFGPVSPVSSLSSNNDIPEPGTFRPIVASNAVRNANRSNKKRESAFRCDLCSETFTAKQRLDTHLNSHYGIKKYVCNVCPGHKSFGQASDLTRHEKSQKHQQAMTTVANQYNSNTP